MSRWIYLSLFLAALCGEPLVADGPPLFHDDDIVGFVGGGDLAAAQFTGHLESLLAAHYPAIHFRNFGWEGDTVYEQPRDFGFPPLKAHIEKAHATVLVLQFGRSEALDGTNKVQAFVTSYKKLIADLRSVSQRMILITPAPFERADPPLPNLALRNDDLAVYADAIKGLASEEKIAAIDLYKLIVANPQKRPFTQDGLQLSANGQGMVARAIATEFGLTPEVQKAGTITDKGAWSNGEFEKLRQLVITKNRLWFNYYRPQNWAFLGGDRTEQPSSRDYRNPKIRWFPTEIEKFNGLIAGKEREIADLARGLQ
jgi:lysophospholipase L1-like esterase